MSLRDKNLGVKETAPSWGFLKEGSLTLLGLLNNVWATYRPGNATGSYWDKGSVFMYIIRKDLAGIYAAYREGWGLLAQPTLHHRVLSRYHCRREELAEESVFAASSCIERLLSPNFFGAWVLLLASFIPHFHVRFLRFPVIHRYSSSRLCRNVGKLLPDIRVFRMST